MSNFLFNEKFPESLKEWQESVLVHPYTCPNRGDGKHVENRRDLGILSVVGPRDLKCDTCGYVQHLEKVHFNE